MFKRRPLNQNYYSNRGNEWRNRRAFGNKIHIIKNLVFRTGAVILSGMILYAILFSPVLAVKNIIVEGNKAINGDEIKKIIISIGSQKKWKIFNNNILLIDPAGVESAVRSRFVNIDTIKIEKKFPQTIKIVIKEKSADIAWCNKIKAGKIANEKKISGGEVLASEIPQCYLSDESGIIYEKVGDAVPIDSVKVFRDEPIAIGLKISDENLKNFIRSIFYNFNNKTGLNLAYLYMFPVSERELRLITKENLKIYFDLNRGADGQLAVLNAFIKNELKNNDNKAANYDYIDLRVVDRVYYKVKNEVKTN